MWRAFNRRRLGILRGDDEGRTMVAEADAFLRDAGVLDPERFVALVFGAPMGPE